MKRPICLMIALCAATTLFALDNAKPHRGRPRGMAKPSGGIVEKSYAGNILRVFNTQKAIPASAVLDLTQKIRWTSLIPVELGTGDASQEECPLKMANALVSQSKVGAGVLILEKEGLPMFLTSPDSRWAILNVSPLTADSPDSETLIRRFTKVYWSAIARSLGVGNSGYTGCVLVPFTSLKELDRIPVLQPCPEPFNKMIDSAKAYGINTIAIATYRTACQQGWAPAPTNDVQKAIWDEVHTLPSEPIKIKPESKKVTE